MLNKQINEKNRDRAGEKKAPIAVPNSISIGLDFKMMNCMAPNRKIKTQL